jgi:hypothetical protein
MAWRAAKSLTILRDQINERWPNRSKVSDGLLGDPAHALRRSDHNPVNGVVHAMDITNDPAHGLNSRSLAEALLASRDPRISYVISNGQIASGAGGPQPWVWRKYTGANKHTHHMHLSVTQAGGDDDGPWSFAMPAVAPKPTKQVETPLLKLGSTDGLVKTLLGSTDGLVKTLQDEMGITGHPLVKAGIFDEATDLAVRAFQLGKGLTPDGKVGPYTWEALIPKKRKT